MAEDRPAFVDPSRIGAATPDVRAPERGSRATEALGNLSNTFGRAAAVFARVDQERRITEASNKISEDLQNLHIELEQEPDIEEVTRKWNERSGAIYESVMAEHGGTSDAVKRRIDTAWKRASLSVEADLQRTVFRRQVERANVAFQERRNQLATEAMLNPDASMQDQRNDFAVTVSNYLEAGLITEEQADDAVARFDQDTSYLRAQRDVENDPVTAVQQLKNPDTYQGLRAQQRATLLARAEAAAEREAAESRAELMADVQDHLNSLQEHGITNEQGDIVVSGDPILAAEMSGLFTDDEIRRLRTREETAQAFGANRKVLREARPEEMMAMAEDLAPEPGAEEFGYRQRLHDSFMQAVKQERHRRKVDPAGAVNEGISPQAPWSAKFSARIARQEQRGIEPKRIAPETAGRGFMLFTNDERDRLIAAYKESLDPDVKASVVMDVQQNSGRYASDAMMELIRAGLPADALWITEVDAGTARRLASISNVKTAELKDGLDNASDLETRAERLFRDEFGSTLPPGDRQYNRHMEVMRRLTFEMARDDIGNPAEAAADALWGRRYEFAGSMRIPSGAVTKAQAQLGMAQVRNDIMNLNPETGGMPPSVFEDSAGHLITAITNTDETGVRLYYSDAHPEMAGEPVVNANTGRPIELSWSDLEAYAEQRRGEIEAISGGGF